MLLPLCSEIVAGPRLAAFRSAERIDGRRSARDIVCHIGEPEVVAPCVLTEPLERLVGIDARSFGDHTFGFLDHDATVERFVELLVHEVSLEPNPVLQDRDRGDIGQGLRGEHVLFLEHSGVGPEQVERPDDRPRRRIGNVWAD